VQLDNKNAIVYGAAGAIGGAVARAFARAGARVFLTGRTLGSLELVAEDIAAAGGAAETAEVDASDQASVAAHAEHVVATAGSIDVSFNAVSYRTVQNIPLIEMSLEDFMAPSTGSFRTHFITATTAARHMSEQGSGVIVLLSATSALESRHQMGGFNLACAGIEALTRSLAGEVGRHGVRVVALRPNFTPETVPGLTDDDAPNNVRDTLLGRLPRLREVAESAVYLASDAAGAMTGSVLNLSCGAVLD
jgi:NAD(P)-dependent dehydrogenase (short-subunit alcohol dehydrogenase family)